MARIIISADGEPQREIPLVKQRITIGRGAQNDVVIDHITISSQHAVIVTTPNDMFLEDLGSTNGTKVNGQPIRKHFLQHDDVIGLAGVTILYRVDDGCQLAADDQLDLPAATADATPVPALLSTEADLTAPTLAQAKATIRVLNGTSAGKELSLAKPVMTIGRPGLQVLAIASLPEGFVMMQVEGRRCILVNGRPIDEARHLLQRGDRIDLSGTMLEFALAD